MKKGNRFTGKREVGTTLQLITHSPEETQKLGKMIGELVQPGDIILLVGELGSGKTCLTQGIAWGLGVRDYALSPAFVILRVYKGKFPLYHIDFYRLEKIEEIADLGLEDYFFGDGVVVVEWAEKAWGMYPKEHLLINIDFVSDMERSFLFSPKGRRYEEIVGRLKGWNWR